MTGSSERLCLFESFVASELRKSELRERVLKKIGDDEIHIEPQEKSKFLVLENGQDRFCLKPDVVGYEKEDKDLKPVFIADTKWKILNDDSKNYGISQNDMYQMFAYLTKYECEQGFLIYPEIANNDSKSKIFTFEYNSKTALAICFFPLQDK